MKLIANTIETVSAVLRKSLLSILLAASLVVCRLAVAAESPQAPSRFPSMPVLPPSALAGYGANGRVYLHWNPSIEDQRVTGWHVHRSTDGKQWTRVTANPVTRPHYLDGNLDPSATYHYAVVAVTGSGEGGQRSNVAVIAPRSLEAPKITEGVTLADGDGKPVMLDRKNAITVRWPDGQQLIYDKDHVRVRQWIAADGTPLMQSALYGNGIDLIGYNTYGMPDAQEPSRDAPWLGRRMFTRDYTSPRRSTHPDSIQAFRGVEVRDGRVTFAVWLPLQVGSFSSFTYTQIWETWWPIERNIGGDVYRGLARSIEIKVPTHFNVEGYSLALNDGFGPNGSSDGVTSIGIRWGQPNRNIITWTKSGDHSGWGRNARSGRGYHPDGNTLQTEPFLLYEWDARPDRKAGSLILSAQYLYFSVSRANCDYLKFGVDGIWPNFSMDVAGLSGRCLVETFEYLYASEPKAGAPQHYSNAKMQFGRRISEHYRLQTGFVGTAFAQCGGLDGPIQKAGGSLEKAAELIAQEYGDYGVDTVEFDFTTWFSSPYSVPAEYRQNENFGVNPQIARYASKLRERGIRSSYWMRPEFVKTSPQNAFSEEGFVTRYWGYDQQKFPPATERNATVGFPEIRAHPEWVRCGRNGEFPSFAPYNWVPMSIASGWWDEMLWPMLHMSARLGMNAIFVDGGFGALGGVDYRPLVEKQRNTAVPNQPYWWRFWRQAYRLGLPVYGECMLGWGGANDFGVAHITDLQFPWIYTLSSINSQATPGYRPIAPKYRHALYEVYGTIDVSGHLSNEVEPENQKKLLAFHKQFLAKHGEPDGLRFVNLRRGEPVTFSLKTGSVLAAGEAERVKETEQTETVVPWRYDSVIWQYSDGREIPYPACEKILTGAVP